MRKYSDELIIEHLRERKSDAVSYIIKKYLPMIKFMVSDYSYSDGSILAVGNEDDAEDIFQETLYIIIKKIDSGDLKLTVKFSTYLYAICKNLLKIKLKKRITEQKYKLSEAENSVIVEDNVEVYKTNKKQKIFDHYFLQLSPVCKNILKLSWNEYSQADIAKKLGNTIKYITKRKHECKKRLIELILKNPDRII